MRGYYDDQSAVIPTEFIVNASRMANPLQESEWKSETGAKVSEVLASLKSLRQSLMTEHAALIEKEKQVNTLRLQLEEQDARLESTKSSKEQLLAKTQSEVQKYDALVDDLEKQREEIEDEIESLEAGKIDALDTKDLPAFSKGTLSYPLKKVTVSQGYGKTSFAKKSGFYKSGFHNGIDFSIPSGTSVLAAADGKVIAIGNNGKYAYGRYIAVDHGNGLVTMYGHLSSVTKRLGDKVKRGDAIAKSGNTGNSTGPHLHFTVFSAKSFDVVASKVVKSLKDIPVGATVNPKVYLP
jgi:murein DD-endopeptidase MepM/ murein hydrolase activator NlpD